MSMALETLKRERHALHRVCLFLCREFATAHVKEMPSAVDLEETLLKRYDELAALDLVLASYDPQEALFLDYQEKQRRAVNKIILIGGGSLLKGLVPLASQNFEVPVSLGNAFTKVEYPAFLEKILRETGPGFAVAVGLALRQLEELG